VNSCQTTKKATTAMPSAKINVMVMAVKIFGAADGFRPKAAMEENPVAAMTKAGPNTHREKISVNARLRSITKKPIEKMGIPCSFPIQGNPTSSIAPVAFQKETLTAGSRAIPSLNQKDLSKSERTSWLCARSFRIVCLFQLGLSIREERLFLSPHFQLYPIGSIQSIEYEKKYPML
jgi:hypothetical protein